MPAINLLPPDPQIAPPTAPPAVSSPSAPAANGPADPSAFETVLSNAVNPPPADRLPAADPPPAAVAPPAADPQPVSAAKTTAAPSVTNAKSTSAVDQPVASPDHNAHGQSDGSSAQPSANELQSKKLSLNSAATSVSQPHPQTAASVNASKGTTASDPPPTPSAPPDGPPSQLINGLLLSDTLVSAVVKPPASPATPDKKTEGGDDSVAQAAADTQAPAANPPAALFAGLNLAGSNLAGIVPPNAPVPAPSLPPVAAGTATATNSPPAPASPPEAAIGAASQSAVPAAPPAEAPVATIATAATATLELNSLVQTVTVSEKPASPKDTRAAVPQTAGGDGGLKAPSQDGSEVTQIAAVLPVTSNNSDNSQTAQQIVAQPTPLANGEQPQQSISSPATIGITAVTQTPPQNAPAVTSASSEPFSTTSAGTGILPVDTPAVAAILSDKASAAPPAGSSDSTPAAQPPATANPDFAMFAPAPAGLQAHAALVASGQQNGSSGINAAQVIEQVTYALQVNHASGHEMQLTLSPPDLGSLQISVSVHDGVLSARLEAQSPTTQQILVDNLSQLKNSLTQQGVAFDRIDVRLAGSQTGSGSSGSAESSFAQQQQGAYSWEQNPVFDPTEGDAPPSVSPQTPRLFSRIAATSLDVKV